jgi:4-diphosphocytidyl-2-C-methyl-D-erythritol kinase
MIVFPHCKINLGLHITRKRGDGYHDLETIFYPLALRDALESIRNGSPGNIHFTSTGLEIKGDASNNLCVKAYELLKKDFPDLPGIDMHLHKTIPMGAGLGGGSADGAFAFLLLSRLFQLGLSEEQLAKYALQLGLWYRSR